MARPLFGPPPRESDAVLHVDEDPLPAVEGETVASAMLGAGRTMSMRSPKYRRPRGPYCLSGDCGTCIVRVDGMPNVRACMTPVRDGMRVESQNTFVPTLLDPTQFADPFFGAAGMDHHHFMVKPKVLNVVMTTVARELAGFGELPAAPSGRSREHVHAEVETLVVGAGPAGRALAAKLRDAGREVSVVERRPETLDGVEASTGVFAVYPDERLVAAGRRTASEDHVLTFRARHLVLACGTRSASMPLPDGDRPGVLAARGLLDTLRRSERKLAVATVVVGSGDHAEELRASLDALRLEGVPEVQLVDPADIEGLGGSSTVNGVQCRGKKLDARIVALAPTPSPAHDLAVQAGASTRFDGAGFAVERDAEGRCASFGETTVWAVGDLCGYMGEAAAAEDGARVATSILEALDAKGGDDA